ncbi:hypothetical protein PR048_033704 [Dryococelus australis]|uniref:Uncharacterized protein n=1 Tax=Dryococelus australis TaxID=614101 RepID=A0ABQ9G119_9NEOP|nr:hypothetical protein PR048_033704 [Dryococelus australis]
MERPRNARAGETGELRYNPSTSSIVRHDSHLRKSGVTRPGFQPAYTSFDCPQLVRYRSLTMAAATTVETLEKESTTWVEPGNLETDDNGRESLRTILHPHSLKTRAKKYHFASSSRIQQARCKARSVKWGRAGGWRAELRHLTRRQRCWDCAKLTDHVTRSSCRQFTHRLGPAVSTARLRTLGDNWGHKFSFPIAPTWDTAAWDSAMTSEGHVHQSARPCPKAQVGIVQIGAGMKGDPRENPSSNGIVRHDCHLRKTDDPASKVGNDRGGSSSSRPLDRGSTSHRWLAYSGSRACSAIKALLQLPCPLPSNASCPWSCLTSRALIGPRDQPYSMHSRHSLVRACTSSRHTDKSPRDASLGKSLTASVLKVTKTTPANLATPMSPAPTYRWCSALSYNMPSAGLQGRWKREIPENTRPPASLSDTTPTCENTGATRPRIEPG